MAAPIIASGGIWNKITVELNPVDIIKLSVKNLVIKYADLNDPENFAQFFAFLFECFGIGVNVDSNVRVYFLTR